MKTKKNGLKKNNYTRKQKMRLVDQIYPISDADVLADFNKLVAIGCARHPPLSLVGNDVVNKFTALERLNTLGTHDINFYDVWFNKSELKKENYVEKMVDFYKRNKPNYPEEKMFFRLSNLYFSSISIFKPLVAMDVYCRFKPSSILDFTMGWGGRLVGACALNIPKYIGIDSNINLKTPYKKMSRFLKKHSTTDIDLYFKDALTIDYSKLDYDLVLTSPPYYNLETYTGSNQKPKEEWNRDFYEPIFKMTFQHLKRGGYYCLNIPSEVYETVAKKVLGKPFTKIPLTKSKRTTTETYSEFVYVWKKN